MPPAGVCVARTADAVAVRRAELSIRMRDRYERDHEPTPEASGTDACGNRPEVEGSGMTTSAERKALNEGTFREANERLERVARDLVDADDASLVPFLCECPR